jgi:hypothetical protein
MKTYERNQLIYLEILHTEALMDNKMFDAIRAVLKKRGLL